MTIGIIGAGLMGEGLAARLLAAGFAVHVIAHRNRAPILRLQALGATEAPDLAALAAKVDVILFCVSNSDVVAQQLAELLPHLREGMTIIDTGTSRPDDSRARAAQLQHLGTSFSDCPLTGGPEQAKSGTLGVLCGAEPEVFQAIAHILNSFATTVRHMGEVGSGHSAKLISNFLVTGMIALVAESFALAKKAGVPAQPLFDAMQNGSGNSGVLQKMVAPALQGNFAGYQFALGNALKDISYCTEMMTALNVESELAIATRNFFCSAAVDHPERPVSTVLTASLLPNASAGQ